MVTTRSFVFFGGGSVLHYDSRNVEVPTITIVGSLVQHGIPVMVYR